MNYLNWFDFEDLIDRFNWYKKPFNVIIFCKDNESMNLFIKQIELMTSLKKFSATKERIVFTGENYQSILVMNSSKPYCGQRANAVIYDSNYPANDVFEIICPLASIHPIVGQFAFDPFSLKRVFETKNNSTCDIQEEFIINAHKKSN